MTCSNPLKAFKIGITDSGADKLKICSFSTAWVYDKDFNKVYDYKLIPCGKCPQCILSYSRKWAIRCCLEASYYDSNYFLTLTYDEDHNPRTLLKDDFRYFIKKLRIYLKRLGKPDIRFFGCGEYSPSLRPHFHIIIFNLQLDDLKYFKRSKTGEDLFTSQFLDSIWCKGFIQVGDVNIKSSAYVARYCLKSFNNKDVVNYGLNPEFILMSRRPGLGFSYFDKNKIDIYKTDKIYFDFGDFATTTPPAYYDNLMKKLDSDLISKIKDQRRFKANMIFTSSYLKSDIVDELEYIKLCNDYKEKKFKILRCRDV